MPTMQVQFALRRANFRSGTYIWTSNDIHDLAVLGSAVVCCDIVLTEKHGAAKLNAAPPIPVCPVTSPVWSVVFPSIGALVTDTGGILSHPAIIAMEFMIPAVVATGNATSLLRDGQQVTVDGTAGVVEIP